jgi:hypothetical protein
MRRRGPWNEGAIGKCDAAPSACRQQRNPIHPAGVFSKIDPMRRKLTKAEKRAKRERKKKTMIIFIHGKQKRVPRPEMIDGLPIDEFIRRNADPIWLVQNEMWEYLTPDDEQGDFAADTIEPSMPDATLPLVHLFTDGACIGNPGPGGWAFILKHPENTSPTESGS